MALCSLTKTSTTILSFVNHILFQACSRYSGLFCVPKLNKTVNSWWEAKNEFKVVSGVHVDQLGKSKL